jgi:tRNA1(Val) A37 N6-methylase TrmN6
MSKRIDRVNDDIVLSQIEDGLTFGTDALLLASYINGKFDKGLEIGGGSGIISLLALTRNKINTVDCIEVQEEYAELIRENALQNGLENRLREKCVDIREYKAPSEYDVIFTNPPYMKNNAGKSNESFKKAVARHEIFGDIKEFLQSAKRLLKWGGSFYCVYRPDRLMDLLSAMREGNIEPKRITFVHADKKSESSMVLVEGKRGGKPGLFLTPALFIYDSTEGRSSSEEYEYIMQNGNMPKEYVKR